MSDQSWMSMQENLVITRNAISLQESVDGQEHSNLPSGTQADLFGQEALRVNPSQSLEKVREKTIADTSGLSSLISLESAILQQCLENKLHQLSNLDGSMIYKMTLRKKVTPQQRVYSHLGLSVRTTKGTDSSSQPGAWPTPSTRDHKGGYIGGRIRNGKLSVDTLDVAAQLCGQAQPLSTAETESTVPSQLNPRFSLYLMGYPIEWAYSGEQVTRLSHKRQQK